MATVKVELEVPKESKELLDSALAIVKHFKDGKSLDEAAALLPGVMAAVDGVKQVADEVKGEGLDELAGYATKKVIELLRG